MKTSYTRNGFHKKVRRPLKMLDFARKKLRLRVVKDEAFPMIREIMDVLKNSHASEGFKVASFLPVKGYRYDKDGKKTYFYYLLYWRGDTTYKVQPSVALLAVGSNDFVNGAIKQHLDFIKGNFVSYGIPAPFIRKFERNYQNTK